MKVEALEREFRYNGGLRLPDPNPNLTVGEVINLYAITYPEITSGPRTSGSGEAAFMRRGAVNVRVGSFVRVPERQLTCFSRLGFYRL